MITEIEYTVIETIQYEAQREARKTIFKAINDLQKNTSNLTYRKILSFITMFLNTEGCTVLSS